MNKAIFARADLVLQEVQHALQQHREEGLRYLGQTIADTRKLMLTLVEPDHEAEDKADGRLSFDEREERREVLKIVNGDLVTARAALAWVEGTDEPKKVEPVEPVEPVDTKSSDPFVQITDDDIVKAAQNIVAMRDRRSNERMRGRDTSDDEQLEILLGGLKRTSVHEAVGYGVGPRDAALLLKHIKALEDRKPTTPFVQCDGLNADERSALKAMAMSASRQPAAHGHNIILRLLARCGVTSNTYY